MIHSYYTSAAGMLGLEKGMDITANNISNISTTGYKSTQPTFADLIHTSIKASNETPSSVKEGSGTKLNSTDTVFTAGSPNQTGRALDFALTDQRSFFAVQDGSTVRYTRDGNFHISVENGVSYLTAADGGYVLNPQGGRITVQNENDNVNLGVFTFNNIDGLVRDGNTSFLQTTASGTATAVNNPEIKRSCLESSSVDLADEMTNIIEMQRGFQLNSKMVQLSDEVMQTLNGLR